MTPGQGLNLAFGTAKLSTLAPEDLGWWRAAGRQIELALDLGFTEFDTAAAYGDAEQVLGRALANRPEGPVLQVTSKIVVPGTYPIGPDVVRRVGRTLRLLGTAHRLTVLLHEPCSDPEDTLRVLEALGALVDRGWLAAIGISNVTAGELHRLVRSVRVDVVQNELSYVCRQSVPVFGLARRTGVRGTGYGALAYGLLAGGGTTLASTDGWAGYVHGRYLSAPARSGHGPRLTRIRAAAAAAGLSPLAYALAWAQGVPGVDGLVVGASTPDQLRELAEARDAVPSPPR